MEFEREFKQVSIRLKDEGMLLSDVEIDTSEKAVQALGKYFNDLDREVMAVINLDNQNRPINFNIASMGVVNSAMVHPRELLKSAILSNAASMLLLHNHPSGVLEPSEYDVKATDQIIKVCQVAGIPLLDHVIVGRNSKGYFSFREADIMEYKREEYKCDFRSLEFSGNSPLKQTAENVSEKEDIMNYKVYRGKKVISKFAEKEDAEQFLNWKREQELSMRNEKILDRIAAENDLDRKYPGLFPLRVTKPYYEEARAEIEQEYGMKPGEDRSEEDPIRELMQSKAKKTHHRMARDEHVL